jgi:hypothetical protein
MERNQDSTTMTDVDAQDLDGPSGGNAPEAAPRATADTAEVSDAGGLTTRDLASPGPTGRPVDEAADEDGPRTDVDTSSTQPLLPQEISSGFQRQWEEIQTRFVDEPRGAVQDADRLVAQVMQQLAQSFAEEHEHLEAQWGRGEDISTEDLRVSLQRYRSFFQRLLST